MLGGRCVCVPGRLNLRENEFEDEGAITLARGLATLPALQVSPQTCSGAYLATRPIVSARLLP